MFIFDRSLAKLVSDLVLPCETAQWPSSLTLQVTFFSPANTTAQVQISVGKRGSGGRDKERR